MYFAFTWNNEGSYQQLICMLSTPVSLGIVSYKAMIQCGV